jgi:uncharacterized protein YdeI (YjbR/CyaY-like superfamily)
MKIGYTLDVRSRAGWRAWLRRNHAHKTQICVVYHAKGSGKPSIPYTDAVDEALCFGWIDSTVKKFGPDSRAALHTAAEGLSGLGDEQKPGHRAWSGRGG